MHDIVVGGVCMHIYAQNIRDTVLLYMDKFILFIIPSQKTLLFANSLVAGKIESIVHSNTVTVLATSYISRLNSLVEVKGILY